MDMRVRGTRSAFAFLVSLSVAGTCLATPGLAVASEGAPSTGLLAGIAQQAAAEQAQSAPAAEPAADGSQAGSSVQADSAAQAASDTQAAPDAPAASDAPAVEEGMTVFGGVQFKLPEGYEAMPLSGMMLAVNADSSVVVTVIATNTPLEGIAGADADPMAVFGELATEAAATSDAEVVGQEAVQLADGTDAYAFELQAESDGVAVELQQVYVPLEDGSFVLVQLSYEGGASQATLDEVASVVDSLALAPAGAAAVAPAGSGTYTEHQAAGIAFDVDDSLVYDETSPENEPTWMDADGTLMFGVIPNLVDDASVLTMAGYDLLYGQIAESLGGEAWESSQVEADGVAMQLGGFAFEDVDGLYVGVLGLVAVEDGTLTGVMAMLPADQLDAYGDMLDAMFESVHLA